MHLKDSLQRNVEMEQQMLLNLLSLVSAVVQPKSLSDGTATACMCRRTDLAKKRLNAGVDQLCFGNVFWNQYSMNVS